MFDPGNILPIAREEPASRAGDDDAECDRLHCNDTIGPCPACPIELDTTPRRDKEAS